MNRVSIAEHIRALDDGNSRVRDAAREALVEIGTAAVPALIEAGKSASHRVRHPAIKALGQIADARAAPLFVDALEDKEFDVRWLAAIGLIALGYESLQALLHAIEQRADSRWLREGAEHVLGKLEERDALPDEVQPVLLALRGSEPNIAAPLAARDALVTLFGE